MASISKNFVVKNGLEVDSNLIFADAILDRVGIGTTVPTVFLDIRGQTNIRDNLDVEGITNVEILRATDAVDFESTLNVVEEVAFDSTLDVYDNVTAHIDLTVIRDLYVGTYNGDGSKLVGIVTQIVPGIGIDIYGTQDETKGPGKGIVRIDAYKPVGKTIYVSQNGDDENTGLAENHSKRTIKNAAAAALYGDTIKVFPGVYVEENPIVLAKNVSVEGTELRNCVITPKYTNRDLFHVNNSCHLTDLSFIGPNATNQSAVVALQKLQGVAIDRYFDGARMIRSNLEYISRESVGFLTSGFSGFAGDHRAQDAAVLIDLNTEYIVAETIGWLTTPSTSITISDRGYVFPAFQVVDGEGNAIASSNCADDIRDILRCISYDLRSGGNKSVIGAASSYFDTNGNLDHINDVDPLGRSVKDATIAALNYAKEMTYYIINNNLWINNPSPTITSHSILTQDIVTYQPVEPAGGGNCTDTESIINNLFSVITDTLAAGNISYLSGIPVTPGVMLEPDACIKDVKNVWKGVCFDITRGGNFRSIESAKAYYTSDWQLKPGILKNPLELEQTIATLDYSFNIARALINNDRWSGFPAADPIDVLDAVYDNTTGLLTLTVLNHDFRWRDCIRFVEPLEFTCPDSPPSLLYPSGAFGDRFSVHWIPRTYNETIKDYVYDNTTILVLVGKSTKEHTYVSGTGKVQRYEDFQDLYPPVEDLGMQVDPESGFNSAINSCIDVISAVRNCIGITTTILDEAGNSGISTVYPGNSGEGFANVISIDSASYDERSGKVTITAPGANIRVGDRVEIRDLVFSCDSGTPGSPTSTQIFPSGYYGYEFYVDKINPDDSFVLNVGVSTLPHTYVGGGYVVDRTALVSFAEYDHISGIATITAPGGFVKVGDLVSLRDLTFSCTSGGAPSTQIFPSGNSGGYEFQVLDIITDKQYDVTDATYDNVTGIAVITAPGIDAVENKYVEIKDLEFSCNSGGVGNAPGSLLYPSGKKGYKFPVIQVSNGGDTFSINVGISTLVHTYVPGTGTASNKVLSSNDTFTINVGSSSLPHTYVPAPTAFPGYIVPPFSVGVGPITQGPYVRNCTNFIGDSIGMKVEGFDAEPGFEDDIGVTGTMSVDSYTQYNQGGIGVSITNGGYAQLVSIFTICDDIAIYTGTGGQCDLTNSNASFGNYGLYSSGVGDQTSKSIYRYTGFTAEEAEIEQDKVVLAGVGTYRPYDGQAIYFGELFYRVDALKVTNRGSGYSALFPPNVLIEEPPVDAFGIKAEASVNVDELTGEITSIDVISSGSQYRNPPQIFIDPPPPGGTQASAEPEMYPLYYNIDTATLPYAGISTVILTQNLNNTVGQGTTVFFSRLSLQIATTISFEWVGAGTNINKAKPALGGVTLPGNEVIKLNGGQVVFTSTNQSGNFRIGTDLTINQLTGTISGRAFSQSLLNTVTPLIIALGR